MRGGFTRNRHPALFDGADEIVYASAAEGGAQTALATVAATIFVSKSLYSITSSASATTVGGSSSPIDFAVFKLITNR